MRALTADGLPSPAHLASAPLSPAAPAWPLPGLAMRIGAFEAAQITAIA
jgi:hypothetical protein